MRASRTTLKHIRRSPYQSLAAVFIIMLTFLAITAFSFVVFGASAVINYFESKPPVTAFFKDDAKPADIESLKASIQQTGTVTEMQFVSKQEALERYKSQNKADPLLLDLVSADILPASLEVKTRNVSELAGIAQLMRNSPVVQEGQEGVIYHEDTIKLLAQWTNAIRVIGIVVIILLSITSVIIMMTVIGFKVSQKREEIEIMKLLSATNWYIRWPFILEGILYGVFGTIVGWLVASGGLLYATPYLETFLHGIPILPVSPIFLIALLAGELVIAVFLGVLASSLAVLRYLK